VNLPEEIKMTPMLEQYFEWKKRYPDCLLFFRMGDFYEMFFDDARVASRILDIALTARDPAKKIPMAGVPFHSVESYLAKLVSSGRKVAICEQVSEPDGRSLVDRQVVRVVTPGTFLPGEALSEGRIASVAPQGSDISLALLNCASGVIRAGTVSREGAKAELAGFAPKEIIAPQGFDGEVRELMPFGHEYVFTPRRKEEFNPADASRMICRKLGVSTLSGFGIEDLDQSCGCAGVLYSYIEETQFRSPGGVLVFSPLEELSSMRIDPSSIENLEIVGEEGASLVETLDRCRTSAGKRTLREWILHPLLDPAEISRRQDRVSALVEASGSRAAIISALTGCGDLDRAISRFAFGSGGPRDAMTIRENLRVLPRLSTALEKAGISL
jgi:DNA mismatch repair protein MutS